MEDYDDVVLSKGVYTITIFTNDVTEGGDNTLTVINIPTTKKNQSEGQKETKVVDLLRIKNSFHIVGYLTNTSSKTAQQVKEDLKTIFKGGGESTGNPISLSYDGMSFGTYPEKWTINKLHTPKNLSSTDEQWAHYMVTIDLVEGESV